MEHVIQFGREPNQVFHTFRHVDQVGLDRNVVTSAIVDHLRGIEGFPSEVLYTGRVSVKEVDLEFRAFQL